MKFLTIEAAMSRVEGIFWYLTSRYTDVVQITKVSARHFQAEEFWEKTLGGRGRRQRPGIWG